VGRVHRGEDLRDELLALFFGDAFKNRHGPQPEETERGAAHGRSKAPRLRVAETVRVIVAPGARYPHLGHE
jgi:hypothetical protein